ncbi:MAG: hypothetical protein HPY59_13415 [Anaerolineae bacterium]|nr:hypothetical protein [Anaerolineae bacterium]
MNHKRRNLTISALTGVILLACNLPFGFGSVNPTTVAQTFAAELTETALAGATASPTTTAQSSATWTVVPAPTEAFTATLSPSPTLSPVTIPCNWAQFIADVTFPDDSNVQTGQTFNKTWRLKNIGTCNWTSGYQIIFVSGDQMNAALSTPLTSGIIAPGGTVDATVSLRAPDAAGTYQGYFRLRSASGQDFGIGGNANGAFWVKIVAVAPAAPPPAAEPKPDLYVSEFSLNPPTPVQGSPVHVRVGVYNQGNAAAGAYTVRWWGLSTFSNPSCSWDVPSTNARGGRILECDFTFSSWYPPPKTTRVIVDTGNTVSESDESNNTADYPISVSAP